MMRTLLMSAAVLAAFSCAAQAQSQRTTGSVAAVAPTATVFSSVLASSPNRTSCVITNIGTTQGYCQFKPAGSSTPTTANAIPVAANSGQFFCSVPGSNVIVTDEVDCTCASGTCAFAVNATGQ